MSALKTFRFLTHDCWCRRLRRAAPQWVEKLLCPHPIMVCLGRSPDPQCQRGISKLGHVALKQKACEYDSMTTFFLPFGMRVSSTQFRLTRVAFLFSVPSPLYLLLLLKSFFSLLSFFFFRFPLTWNLHRKKKRNSESTESTHSPNRTWLQPAQACLRFSAGRIQEARRVRAISPERAGVPVRF